MSVIPLGPRLLVHRVLRLVPDGGVRVVAVQHVHHGQRCYVHDEEEDLGSAEDQRYRLESAV